MADNFNTALRLVLADEGGNSDDPQDHGGRTSRGITQREYDHWCSLCNKEPGDVWNCSSEDIASIYKDQYWNPYCPDLPTGLDYLFFDISVNAGRSQAVKQFQRALGITVDGMMGVVTKNSINQQASQDITGLIKRISDARRAFYRALKQFPLYGNGWLNRVNHAENAAISMAGQQAFVRPKAPANKADETDTDTTSVSPTTSGTVATGSGGLIAILQNFHDALAPYADTIKYITYALLAIGVLSFGYSMYGLYKQNKVDKAV